MGQQQVLLLALGVVIVGIAVVVGISAFSESTVVTNSDTLLQSALRIASEAQTWKVKPEFFSGSPDATKSDAADFSEVTFYRLGMSHNYIVDEDCYRDQVGEFALFAGTTGLGILATSVTNQNMIGLAVTGSTEDDIQLYSANWNPVRGGVGADGGSVAIRSHQRCKGKGQTPLQVGVSS